jgi:hypothetical protein
MGAQNESWLERVTLSSVNKGLNKMGGVGYGVFGEAMLQAVGLNGLYEEADDNIPEKVRSVFRNYVAGKVVENFDRRFDTAS